MIRGQRLKKIDSIRGTESRLPERTLSAQVHDNTADLLKEVVKLLKQGKFNEVLRKKVDKLWLAIKLSGECSKPEYYKAAAIVSEVKLYFGDRDQAVKVIECPAKIFQTLQNTSQLGDEERLLAREQVRAYQAWIHAAQYYSPNHDYESARVGFEFCRDFVKTKLSPTNFGTKAQTEFLIGKVLRQLHSYTKSEEAFVASIEFYNQRAEQRKMEYEQRFSLPVEREPLIQEEALFLNRKIAVSLEALCWLDYTRGRLSAAHQKAITAKVLLTPCEDPMNDACLDWLRASIMRCRAHNSEELMKALRMIKQAEETLAEFKEHPYVPRIKYEKALINLALARLSAPPRFEEYLERARAEASEVIKCVPRDIRWRANSLIVKSRVAREQLHCDHSITLAQDALKLVDGKNQVLCEVDAYLARAEARIRKSKLELKKSNPAVPSDDVKSLLKLAREDLQKALQLNEKSEIPRTAESQNEKTFAVAWINIARSFALEREKREAEIAFRHWKDVEGNVEHCGVHAFAETVRREIDARGDFIICEDESNLKYRFWLSALRAHLIRFVKQQMPRATQKQWADRLGICPPSFINWSKETQQPLRAATDKRNKKAT